MAKRTVEDIQSDFNELGSKLLQVELSIERFKEALTASNNDKNKFLQKLLALDNEFQKIKYSGLQVAPKEETPNAQVSSESAQASVEAAPSADSDPSAVG